MSAAGIPPDRDDTSPWERTPDGPFLPDDLIAACARHDHVGAAIAWARMGFRVLPVWPVNNDGTCACGRFDCPRPGKHPLAALIGHGVGDATTDIQTIRQWFYCWADANIGVAMGGPEGLIALDVDPRNGGDTSLRTLHAASPLPRTTTEITGGGGEHRLFRLPPQEDQRSFNPHAFPGLEVKGAGSYIVTAPARHASLNRYAWIDWETPIAVAPEILRQRSPRNRRLTPRTSRDHTEPEDRRVRVEARRVVDALLRGACGDRVARLISGISEDYKSPSEADAALASYVAFVSDDPHVLREVIVRSGLNRKKYHRSDYLELTVSNAQTWREARRAETTPVIYVATASLPGAGLRGKRQQRYVAHAIVRQIDATPADRKTADSFARVPVGPLAECLGVHRTTVWRAVERLIDMQLVTTRPVERTQPSGTAWVASRWVRLNAPLEEVLAAIDSAL